MIDYLPQATLLRLLAVLALVLVPHFLRLPVWETAAVLAVGVWRALAALRQWRMPPTALKVALTFGAFAGVYASYGNIAGQNAGVALLTIMLALKLTEMKARRDVMVVVFLMYFILVTHFLFSQEIWTIAYLLISAVAITALLAEANHPGIALSPKITLRLGAIMIAQALPLMLLIFVLFPRIPGPLWGLPADAGAARSGLSDSMSPGDIASLSQSDEVALRVTFDGEPPPPRERYWRGPVFDFFDGRTWREGFRGRDEPPPTELLGEPIRYQVTLEPNRTPWLFALDLAALASLPENSRINVAYQIIVKKPVIERMQYSMTSHTRYRMQPELPEWLRNAYLRLPKSGNDKTRALAQQWSAQGLGGEALVQRALQNFRNEPFFYTLEPPMLGRDSVDEFLFETRRGFCEHYASSFTVLMRAAGLPARVVTGYQGGERNEFGDYFVVRQSDAHAWSEIWIEGRGWIRVDPTAAVAPERIERGSARTLGALDAAADAMSRSWNWSSIKYRLEARWDFVNAVWNDWVLGFGPEKQQEVLARFGIREWRDMILALTFGIVAILSLVGLWALRRSSPPPVRDRALKLWLKAQRRVRRYGLEPRPAEGPRDFTERVIAAQPVLAAPMRRVLHAYLKLRYLGASDPELEQQLGRAVRALRV